MPWNVSSIFFAHRALARALILPRAIAEVGHIHRMRLTERISKNDDWTLREFEILWRGIIDLNHERIASLAGLANQGRVPLERLLYESRVRLEEVLQKYEKAIGTRANSARDHWVMRTWMNGDLESVKRVIDQTLKL